MTHSALQVPTFAGASLAGVFATPRIALAAFIAIFLNLILPKESEGLAIDAPAFDRKLRTEAAREATPEA